MKICIWTSKIFVLGGTRRVATLLANELSKKHEVVILTHEPRKNEDRNMYGLHEDIEVKFMVPREFSQDMGYLKRKRKEHLLNVNNKTGKYNNEANVETLKEIIYPKERMDKWVEFFNAQNFDVIIATATFALMLATIAPQLSAKTIGWQHSNYAAYLTTKDLLFWKKEKMLERYFPNLDAYVVLTEYDVDAYKKNNNLDAVAIHNPCSIESDKTTDYRNKNFFIGARFEYVKGVDLALEAFTRFCARNDEWNLIIAGDGDDRRKLINYTWKHNIQDRVIFVGQTNDMEKQYLRSSVYLMTSRWEGWGLVVTEAFKMGLPVLAFDIKPMDLIITDGEDGMLIPQFDIDAYTKAMLKIAEDDEMRKTMAENAAKSADKFTVEKFCREWEELLFNI